MIGKKCKLKTRCKVSFPGGPNQPSTNVQVSNEAMAEAIGGEDFAYTGKTFYSLQLTIRNVKKGTTK